VGQFDEQVRRALDALPPDLAQRLDNVAVVVEEENPGEPDLFGLFEEAPYLPAKVTIYRRPARPAGARARDPGHRPPRARPLLRNRREAAGGAGLPVTSALNAIAVGAAVVGVVVLVLFFLGPRE